jgi:hypothetical protein
MGLINMGNFSLDPPPLSYGNMSPITPYLFICRPYIVVTLYIYEPWIKNRDATLDLPWAKKNKISQGTNLFTLKDFILIGA